MMDKDSRQKLGSFFSQFKLLHYKKNAIILRPEDSPQGVYYLHKGYVRLYALSQDGEELTLIIFKPEDFFPMMWAINDIQTPYYLEAMTAIELWRVSRSQFLDFIKENPDILFELTSRIVTRLGGLLERMEYLVFGNAYQKVASILAICAQRFGEKEGGQIKINVPLTHKDIAMLLGLTRETVSLEMKKLEKKGIITYHGRMIFAKNGQKLENESLLNGTSDKFS